MCRQFRRYSYRIVTELLVNNYTNEELAIEHRCEQVIIKRSKKKFANKPMKFHPKK